MSAPDFYPVIGKEWQWLSIGNGKAHETARELANLSDINDSYPYLAGGVGLVGGVADSVATSIIVDLLDAPLDSVSDIVQTATAHIDGCRYGGIKQVKRTGAMSVVTNIDVPLIKTWPEVQHEAQTLGLSALAAST